MSDLPVHWGRLYIQLKYTLGVRLRGLTDLTSVHLPFIELCSIQNGFVGIRRYLKLNAGMRSRLHASRFFCAEWSSKNLSCNYVALWLDLENGGKRSTVVWLFELGF